VPCEGSGELNCMKQHRTKEWLKYRHGSHAPTSLSARDKQQSDAASFSDVP
jgi:hypothetical protein